MFSIVTNIWYFWMIINYISVASMGCHDSCNISTLPAFLGSVVLLPCRFGSTYMNTSPDWVVWRWGPDFGSSLVNITSSGQLEFRDHRDGRVKAFPNQGVLGNFSIRIDALQTSDLGSYCCEKSNNRCFRVDLEEGYHVGVENIHLDVLYFSVGGGVVILIVLLSACFCWVTWKRISAPLEDVACNDSVGRNPTQETVVEAGHERPIYVSDSSEKKRQGFHRELLTRLRQSSLGRHYYANQAEINQEARTQMAIRQRVNDTTTDHEDTSQMENTQKGDCRGKRTKKKCEYENPIYNHHIDHLNKP
ncbi:hypothetical protein DPEC_G00246370 [Dallia pectoralis]|uniref:Uncharacterized protein n=1 Tax=Dallia pectoralis TaxID=75939 RepID=A0ACC2FWN2_DALPE|nr:hypothetical protein DPEC_G00246370 [Dallia pectoralis]